KHTNASMNGENFRIIQNECDEKFDLAKQTGIEYKHFLALFYRYRNDIDTLIDNAYKLMEQYRNPQKIWTEVEAQHTQKKYSPFNHF
nr:hypothetical protein [Prolixibacteraceae bacterium]